MSLDVFLALLTFAFVASLTPGPNNMMLLASGVNFGFVRTIPHMCGIGIGFTILLLAVGFGLGALLVAFPVLQAGLKGLSIVYLLWLAWKVATSRTIGEGAAAARPMSFLAAVAFQWVNPKAWAMAVVAMGAYTSLDRPVLSVIVVAGVFGLVNFPTVSLWAGFGVAMRRYLADPVRLKRFNILMGVALVASVIPILF